MTRSALVLASLVLALAAADGAAGAVEPLPALNGVRCRMVVNDSGVYGYSCGSLGDRRSYVVTIEFAARRPYGPRPADVRSGSFVRTTRTGCSGHVYVMVVATRTDGAVGIARSEAATAARYLARLNSSLA